MNSRRDRSITLKWGDLQLTVEEYDGYILVGFEYDGPEDKHERGSLALCPHQWRALVELINHAHAALKIPVSTKSIFPPAPWMPAARVTP